MLCTIVMLYTDCSMKLLDIYCPVGKFFFEPYSDVPVHQHANKRDPYFFTIQMRTGDGSVDLHLP